LCHLSTTFFPWPSFLGRVRTYSIDPWPCHPVTIYYIIWQYS
jgi:hypothetical protein